jgi:hypothetical protein
MPEELDNDAKKLKSLKNFLSLFTLELEWLCANKSDLPRAKQLELLNATSGYVTTLDTNSIVNATPDVEKEIEKLKDSIEAIVNLLRDPPVRVSTYELIAKLARVSIDKIRAVEYHLERTRKTEKSRKRRPTAKMKYLLTELEKHPEWMASAYPRGR